MSGELTTPVYRSADLVAFASALFRRASLDPDKAGTVAEVLVEGDLLGHTTHGLALAPPYLAALEDGSMAPKRQALAAGLSLYPGIMTALEPWAKKLGVALPAPAG